jgi:hypothetical protein
VTDHERVHFYVAQRASQSHDRHHPGHDQEGEAAPEPQNYEHHGPDPHLDLKQAVLKPAVLDTANQPRRDCRSKCAPGARCRQDNANGDGRHVPGVSFGEEDHDERLADKCCASGQQQRDFGETVLPQPPEPVGHLVPQAQARCPLLAAAGLALPDKRQSASGESERDSVGQEGKDPPEAEQEPAQRAAHQDDHMSPGFAAGQGRHQLRWFHQGTGEASLSQL